MDDRERPNGVPRLATLNRRAQFRQLFADQYPQLFEIHPKRWLLIDRHRHFRNGFSQLFQRLRIWFQILPIAGQ